MQIMKEQGGGGKENFDNQRRTGHRGEGALDRGRTARVITTGSELRKSERGKPLRREKPRETSAPEEEFEPLKVTLVRPLYIRSTAEAIATTSPNWEQIEKAAQKHHQTLKDDNNAISAFSELYLDNVFEKIVTESDGRIVLNPIPHGAETEHFTFYTNKYEHTTVSQKIITPEGTRGRQPITEYDTLAEIDGIPTIGELKLTQGQNSMQRRVIRRSLNNHNINRKFEPLREYYGDRSFGYIFVGAQETTEVSDERAEQKFINKGGIVIPFPVSIANLEARVARFKLEQSSE